MTQNTRGKSAIASARKTVVAGKKAPTRDPERTRSKILAAATVEFAACGFDGARIDAIVAKCKISKNLVYHYFSGKEELFIRVMEAAYADMRERQSALAHLQEDPVKAMRALVLQMVEFFMERPQLIALLSSENLHQARHIRKSPVIAAMFNPLREALDDIVERGKASGVFRKDVDWVDLYVSISGLASYFVSNRHTLSTVLGVDLTSPERAAKRLKHVPDMVLSYLCDTGSAAPGKAADGA